MPVYEYNCEYCNKKSEIITTFQDKDKQVCPNCKNKLKCLFSKFVAVYKGKGFYATDYRKDKNND